jgi:DNA-binding protein HU-beta
MMRSTSSRLLVAPMATRPTVTKKAPAKKLAAKKPAGAAASAKPATPAPKAKAVAVVTLKAVFEQPAKRMACRRKQARGLLTDFVSAMTTHLKQGDRIRMSGLGILEVKTLAARTGATRRRARPFRSRHGQAR